MRFEFELKLKKYSWGWFFRLGFNKRCLEYDEGLWEYHSGFGKGHKHHSWGARRPYKPVLEKKKEVSSGQPD